MASNVEIKARLRDSETQQAAAAALADGPVQVIEQHDTFFRTPKGRLKLRKFADGSAELIAYQRPDTPGAKVSEYTVTPVTDPDALKRALSETLGVRGVVRKTRHLYLVGQTRVHVDRVEGLGSFLELEVVLSPGQGPADGRAIADRLMQQLGVEEADLIDGAYIDLLERG